MPEVEEEYLVVVANIPGLGRALLKYQLLDYVAKKAEPIPYREDLRLLTLRKVPK